MALFAGIRAAMLYGKAMARFHQARFADAANLLERNLTLDPWQDRKELVYAYLGQCYLALGRDTEAVDLLSKAYEPLNLRSVGLSKIFERQEFLQFLSALSRALRRTGQLERAQHITEQEERWEATLKSNVGEDSPE